MYNDLKMYFDGHISVPELGRAMRNEGHNMIAKVINEALSESTEEDFDALYAHLDTPIIDLLADGFKRKADKP